MTVPKRDVRIYSERLAARFLVGALVSFTAAAWIGGALLPFLCTLTAMFAGATGAATIIRLHYHQ